MSATQEQPTKREEGFIMGLVFGTIIGSIFGTFLAVVAATEPIVR